MLPFFANVEQMPVVPKSANANFELIRSVITSFKVHEDLVLTDFAMELGEFRENSHF